MAEFLIRAGADGTRVDKDASSLLPHQAAGIGFSPVVKYLLEIGYHPQFNDPQDWPHHTALEEALRWGNIEAAEVPWPTLHLTIPR